MTFVVVKKLNGHFFGQEIDGMIDAGVKINEILTRTPVVDYKDVFDTMYTEMAGGGTPGYSVNVGSGGALYPLTPAGGNGKYQFDGTKKFKLKPQEDKEGGQDKAMNFVVPGERQNLLQSSAYIVQMVQGINAIANGKLSPAETKVISEFLLGKIFLSRCH